MPKRKAEAATTSSKKKPADSASELAAAETQAIEEESIWIVGNSLVCWAAWFLLPGGETWLNLGLPYITVTWKGKRGAHLTSAREVVARAGQSHQVSGSYHPRVVIFHLGDNDLLKLDVVQFKQLVEDTLLQCKVILNLLRLVRRRCTPPLQGRTISKGHGAQA